MSAAAVLAYFVRYPKAADTLEGIARWRIQQETIHHTVDQVRQALGWLVDQGFLVREAPPAAVAPTFRLNATRSAEAEHFLAVSATHSATAGARAEIGGATTGGHYTRSSQSDDPHTTDPSTADASHSLPSAPAPSALLAQALTWVDATLLRHLRRNPPSGSDLPGLTRSHASLEAALAPRIVVPSTAPLDPDLTDANAGGDAHRATRAAAGRPAGAADAVAQDAVDRAAIALIAALDDLSDYEPLAALYRNLGLTPIELEAVLLCLAPEIDATYQTIYGVLNDDLTRRTMTLGLLCATLGDPLTVRNALVTAGGLARWRLLEHGATLPYADEPLRLDAAVVAWLLGDEQALLSDARLSHALRTTPWPGASWIRQPADLAQAAQLTAWLTSADASWAWITLAGPDVDGWRAIGERASMAANTPIVRISVPALAAVDPADVQETIARLTRGMQLLGAVPVLDAANAKPDVDLSPVLTSLIEALTGAGRTGLLIAPDAPRFVRALPPDRARLLHRDAPDAAALAQAYAGAAAEAGIALSDSDADGLATAFPLTLGGIADAVRLATLQAPAASPGGVDADPRQAIAAACRRIAAPDLPRFAHRVSPMFTLADVVLPPDRHSQLNEMVSHVRHASQVLNTWGFGAQLPYGRGVAALFCGPSGTGKTMAALAIAHALQTETYVVDLSRVVSKYIGESEKNLDAVFGDAERAGAVLLFDEADALFGKRSEIKDAHDRYANIEVAYLLQRMEAFSGLAILTTNFKRNVDDAFLRRLRFVVDFARPGPLAREAIWRQCLPADAPIAHDVNLRQLARRLELTGGNIRQITVRAAFAAASERAGTIEMRHVVAATRAELRKLGMESADRALAEFEAAARGTASRVA